MWGAIIKQLVTKFLFDYVLDEVEKALDEVGETLNEKTDLNKEQLEKVRRVSGKGAKILRGSKFTEFDGVAFTDFMDKTRIMD